MITDSNIERKSSRYWCILADQNVQALLNELISKYNESKESLNEATPAPVRPATAGRTLPPRGANGRFTSSKSRTQPANRGRTQPASRSRTTPPRGANGRFTSVNINSNSFKKLWNSKIVGAGLKVGTSSVLVGAGLSAAGYVTAEAAEKVRAAFCGQTVEQQVDFIRKLLNSPDPGDQQMGEILKSQFIQNGGHLPNDGMPSGWSLDGFKDMLKTAGITVACIGAAYALWQCRGMISSLFSSKKKEEKPQNSEPAGATLDSKSNELGDLIAKCEFSANGEQLQAVIDTDTCKWSLQDSNSNIPSDDDIKSYFKTKHFKSLTGRCYELMEKYVGNEAFEKIAVEIQNTKVPDEAKRFFKEIADDRKELLANLKSGAYNK